MTSYTYSFASVMATLSGPGGSISLGNGAGTADEGITVEPTEDVGTMTTGSDGTPMHSLHAARPGRATVRLLKTSPTNALLSQLFAQQTSNPANHGRNTIVVSDIARGDLVTCSFSGFARHAPITWAKDANFNEWSFNVGRVIFNLGSGSTP